MMEHYNQVILIDIDALLDVRYALLYEMNEDWTHEHLMNGKYRRRISDIWDLLGSGISQEEYDRRYANRDKELLKKSTVTDLLPHLINVLEQYSEDSVNVPEMVNSVFLVINTYPYKFTKEEHLELIDVIQTYTGTSIEVRVTELSVEEMSLDNLCQLGYTQYVTYEFDKWMNYHYNDIPEGGVVAKPAFHVIAPMRYIRRLDELDRSGLAQHGLTKVDPYEFAKELFSMIFTFTTLPLEVFSIVDFSAYVGKDDLPNSR